MTEQDPVETPARGRGWSAAEADGALVCFALAITLVGAAVASRGIGVLAAEPGTALFFLIYGLLTISIGYRQPKFGYYSFDRVSQIASLLVLGPVAAACVNGLASLLYPWHRLARGVPVREVILASVFNSGLMASIVLLSGLAYEALGGTVPLTSLAGPAPILLVGLVLTMQALNDLGMFALMRLGRRDTTGFLQPFAVGLELGAGATAVLVAIVFNTMPLGVFVLLLAVLTTGMFALRQFANMRLKLEAVVAQRTRSLELKTRELEQLAIHDNLTGLYNRRHAEESLLRQLEQDSRAGRATSVALADIDRFKQINDRHSHAAGDRVLRQVATTLRARCRKSDMIARYGGEEFLIVFPDTAIEQANAICETLRLAIATHDWKGLGVSVPVTISFGITESRRNLGTDVLLEEADVRLYEAKNGGRNRVVA